MKVNNGIEINDVNYDEIEEVDEITLYDSIDGWIDESIYFELSDDKLTMITPEEEDL